MNLYQFFCLKRNAHKLFFPILIVTFGLLTIIGCGGDGHTTDKQGNNMIDSGSWYETGFTPWPHDGNPLEGENFIIYSDAASLEARQYLLQICEEEFTIIKEKLGITDVSIFNFPAGRNNKIHIYAYKNYAPSDWGGQAYYGGYLIYSSDNPARTNLGHTVPDLYEPTIRHELVHVVQTLIVGDNEERVHSWFAEGIAIDLSDDNFYTKITTQEEFDSLIDTYGMRNPISIEHSWNMPDDIEHIDTLYYYPMFWLSVSYLVDPDGYGGSFYDVRDIFIDVGNGTDFKTSFETIFGISFTEYENQFFDLMNDYLE